MPVRADPPVIGPAVGPWWCLRSGEAGTGRVELAVAVFPLDRRRPCRRPGRLPRRRARVPRPRHDPVRQPTTSSIRCWERGDVVFFDQRGAGRSTPRLGVHRDGGADPARPRDQPFLDDDEATGLFRDALSRCRQRFLDDGVPLASFNTINNAHDVEAIRIAPGLRALEPVRHLLRDQAGAGGPAAAIPTRCGPAVLDSVYPPQVDSVLENPASFLDSYRRVVDACNAEPACGGRRRPGRADPGRGGPL